MPPSPGCPDRATIENLLDDLLTAADRPTILAHLEACPTCTALREEIAGTWSLGGHVGRQRAGTKTQAALAEIGTKAPDISIAPGLENTPPPIPTIPGLDDFRLVARGGMGIVYQARDTALNRLVAAKVLAGSWQISADDRARAEREALLMARLDHPGIVRILAAGSTDGLPYLVMEWVAGETLWSRAKRGTLPSREAARIGRDERQREVLRGGLGRERLGDRDGGGGRGRDRCVRRGDIGDWGRGRRRRDVDQEVVGPQESGR